MKFLHILLSATFISCNLTGQNKIESFPTLNSFVVKEFANSDNIFPIALINIKIDNKSYKIPISYSFLYYGIDSTYFTNKKDNVDNHCFEVLENGLCKPQFKKEALKLPLEYLPFFEKAKKNYDSVKLKINLKSYIKFLTKPDWWQDDKTPKDDEGKPLRFICQLELKDITTDDCSLYIFFDTTKKVVRQIYQRD